MTVTVTELGRITVRASATNPLPLVTTAAAAAAHNSIIVMITLYQGGVGTSTFAVSDGTANSYSTDMAIGATGSLLNEVAVLSVHDCAALAQNSTISITLSGGTGTAGQYWDAVAYAIDWGSGQHGATDVSAGNSTFDGGSYAPGSPPAAYTVGPTASVAGGVQVLMSANYMYMTSTSTMSISGTGTWTSGTLVDLGSGFTIGLQPAWQILTTASGAYSVTQQIAPGSSCTAEDYGGIIVAYKLVSSGVSKSLTTQPTPQTTLARLLQAARSLATQPTPQTSISTRRLGAARAITTQPTPLTTITTRRLAAARTLTTQPTVQTTVQATAASLRSRSLTTQPTPATTVTRRLSAARAGATQPTQQTLVARMIGAARSLTTQTVKQTTVARVLAAIRIVVTQPIPQTTLSRSAGRSTTLTTQPSVLTTVTRRIAYGRGLATQPVPQTSGVPGLVHPITPPFSSIVTLTPPTLTGTLTRLFSSTITIAPPVITGALG